MEEYETIGRARAMLQAVKGDPPSRRTIAGYERMAKAIGDLAQEKGSNNIDTLIAVAKDTKSANTWFSRRAALSHSFRRLIENFLTDQDRLQRALKVNRVPLDDPRWDEWRALVGRLGKLTDKYERLQQESFIAVEERRPRQSKRKHMRGLPEDWRERIVARMPKYRLAVLTQAVTGCRPDELTKGVKLSIEDGELVALIEGSKVTGKSGQPWRRMSWPVDSDAALVSLLVKEVGAGAAAVAKIEDAKTYSGAVRSAGEREWPKRVNKLAPYCFRHAAASDMKASGMEDDVISQALGHCADVARSYYGSWQQGRKTGGVTPKTVSAARPVRISKPVSSTRRPPMKPDAKPAK